MQLPLMTNDVPAVEECDARDDERITKADIIKKIIN